MTMLGLKHSEESKRKISESMKKVVNSNRFKKGNEGYWLGKSRSKETKIKISEALKGEKNFNWKGGKVKKHNRWFILKPEHPFTEKDGYICQYRLIMEQKLGRYLRPEEVVHHKNGNTLDDRPKNLMLFSSSSAHTKYHTRSLGNQLESNGPK